MVKTFEREFYHPIFKSDSSGAAGRRAAGGAGCERRGGRGG